MAQQTPTIRVFIVLLFVPDAPTPGGARTPRKSREPEIVPTTGESVPEPALARVIPFPGRRTAA